VIEGKATLSGEIKQLSNRDIHQLLKTAVLNTSLSKGNDTYAHIDIDNADQVEKEVQLDLRTAKRYRTPFLIKDWVTYSRADLCSLSRYTL
jgi:hypothetical protein